MVLQLDRILKTKATIYPKFEQMVRDWLVGYYLSGRRFPTYFDLVFPSSNQYAYQ